MYEILSPKLDDSGLLTGGWAGVFKTALPDGLHMPLIGGLVEGILRKELTSPVGPERLRQLIAHTNALTAKILNSTTGAALD